MMESHIDGVQLVELRQINDARGAVLHMLRCDSPDFVRFGEIYFSEIHPGAVKAWRRHRLQTQTFAVPVGRIRIVIYDPRPKAPSHGQLQVLELGRPDAYWRLRIGPGLWYGFSCLGQAPALIANCADLPHDGSESESCPPDSTLVPFRW